MTYAAVIRPMTLAGHDAEGLDFWRERTELKRPSYILSGDPNS